MQVRREYESNDGTYLVYNTISEFSRYMGLISSRQQELFSEIFEPYVPEMVRSEVRGEHTVPVISYGQGSYGYDIRLSSADFRLFHWSYPAGDNDLIDPKDFNEGVLTNEIFCRVNGHKYFMMPPHSYALGVSVERISMPSDCHGITTGKSTYARCGIIANITPIEAGWVGHLTIELANTSPLPVKVYANEGIAQINIFEGDTVPIESYADRNGKYQNAPHSVAVAKV